MSKIDWKNHLIAFLSAVIGILIAFQLEDLREDQQEAERLKAAYQLVEKEIENNISIYQHNVKVLTSWLQYYSITMELQKITSIEKDLSILNTITEDSVRINRLNIFDIEQKDENTISLTLKKEDENGEGAGDIHFDILPETGVATSAWTSSINSGIFTQLHPKKLQLLTEIYDWTQNDLGLNESGIFDYQAQGFDRQFDNIDELVQFYKEVLSSQELKLRFIMPAYEDLETLQKGSSNL